MGRGAWKATVQGVLESDTSEPLSLPLHGMILKSKLTVIIKICLNTHTHTHKRKTQKNLIVSNNNYIADKSSSIFIGLQKIFNSQQRLVSYQRLPGMQRTEIIQPMRKKIFLKFFLCSRNFLKISFVLEIF